MCKDNYLTYSIEPKYTQYLVGNDLERPGQIKPEVISIYQGSPGPAGKPGEPGRAATVTIGNVTSGSTPSVVNTGTSTNAVLDFVLVPGEQGQTGPAGQDGQSATISVGTTTTGEPGSNASVTNSGTSSAAVLNFTIPRGNQGEQGNPGVGVPQGGTSGQILAKIDSTDYNTEWINAPSGGDTDSLKELGTRIVVRSSADDYGTSKTLTVVLNSVAPYTGKQSIDWGDGSVTDTQNSGTYTHEYAEYGYYTLTFYGNSQPIHVVDISDIYFGTAARNVVVSGKVSTSCTFYNIGQLNAGMYRGTDFGGWSQPQDSRKLGRAYTYYQMVGELVLPPALVFDNTFIGNSVQMTYLQSVVFPACTTQLINVFPTGSWQQSSTFTRIEMRGKTPPSIISVTIPSTVTEIIVPWSSDHSVYTAYKTATGWSTYASIIYEAPAPTQPV